MFRNKLRNLINHFWNVYSTYILAYFFRWKMIKKTQSWKCLEMSILVINYLLRKINKIPSKFMPWLTLAAFNIYVGDGILMIVS